MKKDIALMVLTLALMVGCNSIVEDSRIMTPPVNVLKKTVKEITKHIDDARYLVTEEPEEEVQEEIQEEIIDAPEDSYQETIEEYIEEPSYFPMNPIEPPGLTSLGEYMITAYEWTGNPCANGNYPTEGYTVACNDLPLGAEVYIDGVGYRVVEDRGGGGYGWMDLYLGDEASCYEWGVQYREVWLVG